MRKSYDPETNFENVNLTNVDYLELDNANLKGANLHRTSIKSAENADLKGADLTGAIFLKESYESLSSAQLTGAKYDSRTKFPPGFKPEDRGMIKVPQKDTAPAKFIDDSPREGV